MRPCVSLIGAGPGDPELLTLKAARAPRSRRGAGGRAGEPRLPRACTLQRQDHRGRHARRLEVDIEVIPGVTAGTAVPASLGIPVTHREFARGVTFVTGHTKDGTEPHWQALARSGTTLVICMGLKSLQRILSSLIAAGMNAATPACFIENGTLHDQRQRVATLGTLSGQGFSGPALIVVGEVVRFARAAVPARQATAA